MIKTFRGILEDGGQVKVRLSTKKGKIGYKIKKFLLMPEQPGNTAQESVVKIFKIKQTTIPTSGATVDLSDGNLLAVGYQDLNTQSMTVIIFEQEIFNQDIFITYTDNGGGANEDCNYYLELETINMTDIATAVSTLRDIRLNPQVGA
jgi:hypothetical protein